MTGPALSGVCAGGAVRIQFSVGHKRDGAGEMAWGEGGGRWTPPRERDWETVGERTVVERLRDL